ncbi:sorbitol dehydrogenase-like protein [Leptotrombidium deliense]|uniref:Sorbitol dehydrogenase n=1 Tax=Leptotrombidium deliense TaxID=299467 RepID=A0A443S675_9ACAR|nr:sorbitol dehydrogenase-like protein [Leptotrombidium deliense]
MAPNALNHALIVKGLKQLQLEEKPIPEKVESNEVLLKINFCGICGSDIHIYEDGHIGSMIVENDKPFAIGHESSATVLKVGSEVKHLQIGDRVAIEPGVPCRNCDFCLQGSYNFCDEANKYRGLPSIDGCMQRYFVHPANFCHKLPENISLEEGALAEPISCALYGVQRAGVKPGDKVLVVGAGPIGLLSLLCAKAYGADITCVMGTVTTNINRERLEMAEKLGADCVIAVDKNDTPKQLAASIEQLIGKVDITLECSGSQTSTHSAILASNSGAKIAIVGIGADMTSIPLIEVLFRQIDLLGVNKCRNTMQLAINLMASGKINVKPIISHKFPLEKWTQAFDVVKQQKGFKVLIEC